MDEPALTGRTLAGRYTLRERFAPAGNVLGVRRTTDFQPHPKFDACMIGALRPVRFAASAAGGSMRVSFSARTRDNP
jgi:hypothetical protein